MKITFEDQSYIEIKKSLENDKIIVSIQAKDQGNKLKTTTNIVELTKDQLKSLISDV